MFALLPYKNIFSTAGQPANVFRLGWAGDRFGNSSLSEHCIWSLFVSAYHKVPTFIRETAGNFPLYKNAFVTCLHFFPFSVVDFFEPYSVSLGFLTCVQRKNNRCWLRICSNLQSVGHTVTLNF